MLTPPRNFAFKGAVERSGAFAAFGHPLLVLFTTLYGLIKGNYVRQEAASQFVENAFRDLGGCAIVTKDADNQPFGIIKPNVQAQ